MIFIIALKYSNVHVSTELFLRLCSNVKTFFFPEAIYSFPFVSPRSTCDGIGCLTWDFCNLGGHDPKNSVNIALILEAMIQRIDPYNKNIHNKQENRFFEDLGFNILQTFTRIAAARSE